MKTTGNRIVRGWNFSIWEVRKDLIGSRLCILSLNWRIWIVMGIFLWELLRRKKGKRRICFILRMGISLIWRAILRRMGLCRKGRKLCRKFMRMGRFMRWKYVWKKIYSGLRMRITKVFVKALISFHRILMNGLLSLEITENNKEIAAK